MCFIQQTTIMATNSLDSADACPTLSEMFDVIWKDYEFLENSSDPSNSNDIQKKVQQAIEKAEKAVRMVNDLSLFSTNEQLEEVATNEIKYLLLPGLLGYFTNKSLKGSRFEIVQKAQVYFIDFVRLCKLYGVTSIDLPRPYSRTKDDDDEESKAHSQPKTTSSPASLDDQMKKRMTKIERFKSQKDLERSLQELYVVVKKETVDDESKRQYYITLLKKWVNEALESCESIEAEIPLLEHMLKMKDDKESGRPKQDSAVDKKKGVFRPFIITKDNMQKQVYGIGYPGVPTFTVDEFYQRRVDEGLFPADGSTPKVKDDPDREEREREKAAKKKEELEEQDDEETIGKARQWDEWKDDHRRGWGNTQNKG